MLSRESTKKLMTQLVNKIIASLYEKAHKLKLQKNPAKSNQDGLETSTDKKGDILLSPERLHTIPSPRRRKGDSRTSPLLQEAQHQHHVGFSGRWLG